MTMRLTCACGRVLGYETRHIGKKVRCGGCDRVLNVPVPEDWPRAPARSDGELRTFELGTPQPDDEPPRPRNLPQRPPRYEDNRNGRKPRPAPEPPPPGFLAGLAGLLWSTVGVTVLALFVLVGIGLTVFGARDNLMAKAGQDTPRTVTLDQLIATGVGDNAHVLVTDVAPAENYVFQVRMRRADREAGRQAAEMPWDVVYVPLVPLTLELRARLAGGKGGFGQVKPSAVRAILILRTARNHADVARVFSRGEIQATVVSGVRSISAEAQKLLRQSYPGTDFSQVVLLEEGRIPANRWSSLVMIIAGVGLTLLAAMLFLFGLLFHPREG